MAKKSVYASVEIADREVRLAVVEIFNNRSNVLRIERVAHSGIHAGVITDEKAVSDAIRQAVSQAQEALSYRIERVLLAIPARDLKAVNARVHVDIEDGTHTIRRFHIQQGLKSAMNSAHYEDLVLVNVNRVTCLIDGAAMDKLPLGFDTPAFDMDVDLLFASKETVFAWVSAVEKAGLKVMDIAIDLYAAGKETGALLQSADTPVILIDLEADHTSLALLNKNRIAYGAIFDQGYRQFVAPLCEAHSLSDATGKRLLENLFVGSEEQARETILYIEQQEKNRVEISEKELAEKTLPALRSWIAQINAACSGILAKSNARFLITGEGSFIPALAKMTDQFGADAQIYTVTSIGARQNAFTPALGLAYVFEDISQITGDDQTSVNNNELEESIESITRYARDQEGGFTKKLKRVMLSNKD